MHRPRRQNEQGSFLVEGALGVLAMALIFLAFVQFGRVAMEKMHQQNQASQRLWYAVTHTPWTQTGISWSLPSRGPMLHVEGQAEGNATEPDVEGPRSIRVGLKRSK